MSLPNLTITLRGRVDAETHSEIALAATTDGVERTLGLMGDALRVRVRAQDWPPEDWDLGLPCDLVFGIDDGEEPETVTLGGYHYRQTEGIAFGVALPIDPESEEPPASAQQKTLLFVTTPGTWIDGRGGVLTAGTLNPLGADGLPDPEHEDYRTCRELAALCITAITGEESPDVSAVPEDIPPPGPLDWGLERAVPALEAVLAHCGCAAHLANDGEGLRVVRLPLPQDPFLIEPEGAIDDAEPFELFDLAAVRGGTVVVTSGRTRTTLIDGADMDHLEWVAFDERTGRWLNAAQWDELHSGEPTPDDIAFFRAGPDTSDLDAVQRFGRLFIALRLSDDGERARKRRIVTLSEEVEFGDGVVMSGTAAVALVRAAMEVGSGQFRNVPEGGSDDPVRLDGVGADPYEGVFILPPGLAYVRMDVAAGAMGAYADGEALSGDDMAVVFAHEAATGDVMTDYFVRAFALDEFGEPVMLDQEASAAALADPRSTLVEAPFLRRLMLTVYDEFEEESQTALNDEALEAAALELAKPKLGEDFATAGEIPLRGLRDLQPGDLGGRVSRVRWEIAARRTTIVVSEHEMPYGVLAALEAGAGRSYAAGWSGARMPYSSVSLGALRMGTAPGGME